MNTTCPQPVQEEVISLLDHGFVKLIDFPILNLLGCRR